MRPCIRSLTVLIVVLLGAPAQAQYGYPAGYGAYGWGGWGGGASTGPGDVARGMGAFAQGAGVYNQQTAVANSINTQTAMQWNQYMWLSQQEANRRQYARMTKGQKDLVRAREQIYLRLRNNPAQGDIDRGDAMNVAYDEITNPKVYLKGQKGLSVTVPGTTIRDIPFQAASAAITTSMEQLTKGGPPKPLMTDTFASERTSLKQTGAQLRKENEETGQFNPATLEKARTLITALRAKVEKTYNAGSRERVESDKFLKALYGLMRMLETPAVNVLLAGVEKRPDTTLGDLLGFMKAFNLRFGAANSLKQRQAYRQIYPSLVKLRDEVAADAAPPATAEAPPTENPGEFFSGMQYEHLEGKKAPAPPVPNSPN